MVRPDPPAATLQVAPPAAFPVWANENSPARTGNSPTDKEYVPVTDIGFRCAIDVADITRESDK